MILLLTKIWVKSRLFLLNLDTDAMGLFYARETINKILLIHYLFIKSSVNSKMCKGFYLKQKKIFRRKCRETLRKYEDKTWLYKLKSISNSI